MMQLKIGKINFANLYPIFYGLEGQLSPDDYRLIEGPPSAINGMLSRGEIDLGPSSSIEYIRSNGVYDLIDGHSISSRGAIESIILFSRIPIDGLGGETIFATYKSETSTALLKVILREFYGMDVRVEISKRTLLDGLNITPAYLLIGDDALAGVSRHRGSGLYIYDLGEIWYRNTGLPFVFALWIVRREVEKGVLYNDFLAALNRSRDDAGPIFEEIAPMYHIEGVTPSVLVSYWRTISYNLTSEHKKGIELFEGYLRKLKII